MDPSRPESPAEAKARRIREEAERRHPPVDRSDGGWPAGDPLAVALRSLPPGWSQVGVVGGERPGRVIVGPGGLAVVQAFTPTGPLTLERGDLREGGEPSAAAASVLAMAAALRDGAGPASRRSTAVLCVPADVPVLRVGDLVVCGVADLVPMLTGGPLVLTPGEVAGAGIRLAAGLRPGLLPGGRTDAATSLEPTPASRVSTAVRVVIVLLLLAGLLLLAPRLGEGLGGALGHCPTGSSSC